MFVFSLTHVSLQLSPVLVRWFEQIWLLRRLLALNLSDVGTNTTTRAWKACQGMPCKVHYFENVYLRADHLISRFICLFASLPVCLGLSVCLSVCLYVCLFVSLSVCLSICLFVCLSVCLSVCFYVCMFVCLSVYLSVCLLVCLFASLPVCLSVCLSVCLFVSLFVCLSICLFVCFSVCLSVFRQSLSLFPSVCLSLSSVYRFVCLSASPSVCLSVFFFFLFLTRVIKQSNKMSGKVFVRLEYSQDFERTFMEKVKIARCMSLKVAGLAFLITCIEHR